MIETIKETLKKMMGSDAIQPDRVRAMRLEQENRYEWYAYLLDELEKANKEVEKVTLERDNENWRAIWYEGHIEDASRSAAKWQQHYINLLEEHKAMKEALIEIEDESSSEYADLTRINGIAQDTLSTLKCTD